MQRAAVLTLALLLASDLDAQRSGGRDTTGSSRRGSRSSRPTQSPPKETKANAVRAELAEMLLQTKRYAEAAREYRRLVTADRTNTSYRLGLAQALAWGGKYRDAERELQILATARPMDASIDSLRRTVRQSLTPGAREAAEWVRENPRYLPYRFALARALVRERQSRAALAHYDTLLAFDASASLLREAAAAHRSARDLAGGLARLSNAVALAPADTGLRRAYIELLMTAGQLDAALAQNDTLLTIDRSALVLMERARINIARRDLLAAETDLGASIAIGPTADAYLALGDLYRWRGDYSKARATYEKARALGPPTRALTLRYAQLARDERPAATYPTAVDLQLGWRTAASFSSDKTGTQYSTISAHRGFTLPFGLIGGAGMEVRDLRERLPDREAHTTGYGGDAGLSRNVSYGALTAQVGALAGVVHHPGAGTRFSSAASTAVQYYAWTVSAGLAAGPAYPSLLTTAFLTPFDVTGTWLTERSTSFSVAGPLGAMDVGAAYRQSRFNDGNRRSVLQVHGRYPLTPRVSALYSGSAVAFAERSTLYWDPDSHITNAVGAQIAEQRPRGFSYNVRVLPGVAWAEDSPYRRASSSAAQTNQMRFLLSAAGDVAYRKDRWELAASYGWGRLGDYARTDARVGLRVVP